MLPQARRVRGGGGGGGGEMRQGKNKTKAVAPEMRCGPKSAPHFGRSVPCSSAFVTWDILIDVN